MEEMINSGLLGKIRGKEAEGEGGRARGCTTSRTQCWRKGTLEKRIYKVLTNHRPILKDLTQLVPTDMQHASSSFQHTSSANHTHALEHFFSGRLLED